MTSALMLSPTFAPGAIGGVELAARLTWDAMVRHYSRATLFTYGPLAFQQGNHRHAHSKAQAVITALRHCWPGDTVLLWHVAMLRLLPFLRLPRTSKVILAIFGIEVWQPFGLYTRSLLKRVNKILTISQHTWKQAVYHNPTMARIPHQALPLGTGLPTPMPAPPDSTPIAFVISRLAQSEDYKGHRELIQAWPRVLEQIPAAELWIAGDGDLRPTLETIVAERNLSERVRFLGRISEEQKADCLQKARCFVMPSRGEGFGLVYLEAMQSGRPCLVSTLDAGQEVVLPANAGLAVNPDDGPGLVTALYRLLTPDSQWQAWSQSGHTYYAAHYTTARYQQRLLAALGA